MKKVLLSVLAIAALAIFSSCDGPIGPEGPTGAAGKDGTNGVDGKDMNETCKLCHKNGGDGSVDSIAVQFELSKHSYGEAAFEEAGNTGCTPCHASEAFQDVVRRNVPATFGVDPTNAARFVNNYATQSHTAYGELLCGTCHNKIHATYGASDIPSLTTVAPVSMTMWAGAKTINLTPDGGSSNLCVKCHQPRPFTNSNGNRNVLDYNALVANPTAVFYDGARASNLNLLIPSYRTHTHYGTVGAVYAGQGGVEFTGTKTYASSGHTTLASCQDCHMAKVTGRAGGHTFTAKGNFNGCNTTGCHTGLSSTSTTLWSTPRAAIKKLLDDLAVKLRIGGVDILNRNGNTSETAMILNSSGQTVGLGVNLWAGLTTNNYDGYLNIYDPITNPGAQIYNPSSFQFTGTIPTTWSQAQKDYNATLPKITLTNAQMGALINFQMCLREYSLGIHNYKYVEALLTNTIATLP